MLITILVILLIVGLFSSMFDYPGVGYRPYVGSLNIVLVCLLVLLLLRVL